VIALDRLSARRKPVSIKSVTIDWGPGIHAVVGTPGDGCSLLLALIVGAARPRVGKVRVLDGAPTDARVRPQIARVGIDPSLPDALRVDEALALASTLRGEPPRAASERLSVLGLEALSRRPVDSLSRQEARGVALAEAVTSSRVRVVVVDEPFSSNDARAASRIIEALRAKSRSGCVVVVATASLRDAGELADDYVLLRAGAILGKTTSVRALARMAPGGARLTILARDALEAKRLVAALAGESDVAGVELEANTVKVRGPDPVTLARAAGRAASEAHVDVVEIRAEPPSLAEARAAVAIEPANALPVAP
jgi:ABC-type multidrug transport system ATPase subunit